MNKKKIKYITHFVILIVLSIIVSKENVKASTGYKLPQKLYDIIEGDDSIYGEGAPLNHDSNPNQRFKSGGSNHTHQYILGTSIAILESDGCNFLSTDEIATIMENTDWPDKLGNETDSGTYSGHFFDPDTGKNWLGQKSPTAKTRAISYFNMAINAYENGDKNIAIVLLGRGTHYISDMNEPHHASNKTALNSNHTEFEKYVDENRANYRFPANSFDNKVYESIEQNGLENIIQEYSKKSKKLYELSTDEDTYELAGEQSVKNAIYSNVAYLYLFQNEVKAE